MITAALVCLAFAAGLVALVSPCCLPLVPGYLSTVCGHVEADEGPGRGLDYQVLRRSLLFVASFSSIFILLGLSAKPLGAFLSVNKPALERADGVAIIAMGAFLIGSVFIVRLNRDWRSHWLSERAGSGGPVTVGAAFALAWTPCVGPILWAVLGLAESGRSTALAGLLLLAYSAGLGVSFLASALAFDLAQGRLGFFPRHRVAIQLSSGLLLVSIGILGLNGDLFRLNLEVQRLLSQFGLDFLQWI